MKDHCTFFPEGNWGKTCCRKHDKRYENKRLSKFQADILLYRCVRKKSNVVIASIMFTGVTLFGHYNYYKAQRKVNDNKRPR